MEMTAEQWQQVKNLLELTLEQPAEQRVEWLERNCPDPETRDEVWSLVVAHIEIEDFLEKPSHTGSELVSALRPESLIGERIGAWRLVEEIGRGGMGTVFRLSGRTTSFSAKSRSRCRTAGWIPSCCCAGSRRNARSWRTSNIPISRG